VEKSDSTAAINLYFLSAGRGQSTAVSLPGNQWIIVDGYLEIQEGITRGFLSEKVTLNPTCELLKPFSRQENFRILAIIVTHFHLDHYGGIGGILDLCQQKGILEELEIILPKAHGDFESFLGKLDQTGLGPPRARSRLRKFLEKIRSMGLANSASLKVPSLVGDRDVPLADGRSAPFFFGVYHPKEADIFKDFLRWHYAGDKSGAKTASSAQGWLQRNANKYSYVLGAVVGEAPEDLHVLLTADIPGEQFQRMTARLREELDRHRDRTLTMDRGLREMVVPKAGGGVRFRPVSGLSIPHHGSGNNVVEAQDLRWWLPDAAPASATAQPPFAVIQGDPRAASLETVDLFCGEGLDVYAPRHREQIGARIPEKLSRRMITRPHNPPPDASPDPPRPHYLRVVGGVGGIHQITTQGFAPVCQQEGGLPSGPADNLL